MGKGRTSVGRFPLIGEDGEVALLADLSYDPATSTVSGAQLVQVYGPGSELRHELEIPLRFALLEIDGFLELLAATGFETEAVYGDYFSAEKSPFAMVCARKRSTPETVCRSRSLSVNGPKGSCNEPDDARPQQ